MVSPITFSNAMTPTLKKAPFKTPISSFSSNQPKTPAFGFSKAMLPNPGLLLKNLDFHNVGETLLGQSMIIYALVISSRVAAARSKNERFEVMRRDFLGWYSWFFGVPLLQFGLTNLLTMGNPKLREILIQTRKGSGTFFSKINRIVNPTSRFFTTTIHQLKQREAQILALMEKNGTGLREMRQVRQLFNKASNIQVLTSFIGLAFTIFAIGIGINLLNIALTRKNVERLKPLSQG